MDAEWLLYFIFLQYSQSDIVAEGSMDGGRTQRDGEIYPYTLWAAEESHSYMNKL